jgi:hypothetical protein
MFWSKETLQLRLMLIVGVLFIVSAFTSCQEIRYTTFGRTTAASIVKTQTVTNRRSRNLLLTYSFADLDGTKRTEEDDVSLDFQPIQDDEGRNIVSIQFIPGSPGASRIPGGGRWIIIGIFVIMLTALSIIAVRFWIDFQKHQRRMARSS